MSAMDFNDAEPQREGGALIPEGTISLAVMQLRSGGYGEGGFLARSKAGEDMLDVEFTLYGGQYDRRKVWKYMSFSEKAAPVTKSQLRGALESAHCIRSDDMTDKAAAARRVASYGDFNGMMVCIKIGIEKGKDGYADKNILRAFVTPDKEGYIAPDDTGGPPQVPGFTTAGAAIKSATGGAKPNWA